MSLKRTLTLPLLILYGLGNILGAGIYVLIGEVAGVAGLFTPLSFLLTSILLITTAFTYSELSSRYPVSAGEAVYLFKAFANQRLSFVIGIMIIITGVLSAAAIAVGFSGYLQVFVDVSQGSAITTLLLILGLLAIWGIRQSVSVAALLTLIEILGLLIIIWVGQDHLTFAPIVERVDTLFDGDSSIWYGILAGSFLAFYAFIGFEDMVNVAEEVIEPEKNMPKAIMVSLLVAGGIYMLVSLVSINAITPQTLAQSKAPLALLYQQITGFSPVVITAIAMLAVVNGALIQIIMGSRVLYGMSQQGWLTKLFSRIHPRTNTPVYATITIVLIIYILALWLPLVTLAKMTSLFILIIFTLMHLSLLKIKSTKQAINSDIRCYHFSIPLIGLITNIVFIIAYYAIDIG